VLRRILNRVLRGTPAPASPPEHAPARPASAAAADAAPDPAELRARWERELARDPLYGPAHAALAELDWREGRLDAAVAHYLTVVARYPDEPELLNNLGALYIQTGDFALAIERLERAVARNPDFALARDNLARALMHARRFAEAEEQERALIARNPESPGLHLRLGHTLLMQGRLDEGWAEYEWRLRRADFNWGLGGLPAWDGSAPEGKAIRVIAEQGLGDAILFARFVPELAARAARVQVLVRPPLERLFAASFASENVTVTTDRHGTLAGLDAHAHMLSLPRLLALGGEALRPVEPYLRAPDDVRARWRPVMEAQPRPRIGIVWAGNPERRGDESRSIPAEALAPLAEAVPGASWVSLQAGFAADAPRPFPLALDPMGEVADYADTAAIIETLDLVVSVDTSVAHAAAAMGKPLLVLAPHNVCWRWDIAEQPSPWYRGVQVFRARRPGEWGPVVEQAAAAIAAAVR
jgi:tetratricopeptide (TPR) repeat protein